VRGVFAVIAATLLIVVGCGTSASPGSGLTGITKAQEELNALDARLQQLPPPNNAVAVRSVAGKADMLADDYEALHQKARNERPSDIRGDEQTVWDSFIEILDLRAQSARAYSNGARSGDMSTFTSHIDGWNTRTIALNDKFNVALGRIRGEEPSTD
jgi:hypothetical protein